MDRTERTEKKFKQLFGGQPTKNEGNDAEFMRILQRFIFGEVCYVGSLSDKMRELVTITVLTAKSALPQLRAHVGACLNIGLRPEEIREAIYECAPFIGFPVTLNAIAAMDEAFVERGITLPLENAQTVGEEDRLSVGEKLQKPVYGDEIAKRYAWLPSGFGEALPRFLTGLCFGDFMSRKGLDIRTRELLTVVLLAAIGGAERQVKSHIAGALKAGNSREEVICALVHAMPYMGMPRLFNALNCAEDILNVKED